MSNAMRGAMLVSAAVMLTATAFAQDTPRWEVSGDYSYMQFNPTLSGLQSRAFNGGGGGIQYNFGKYFAVKGDFQGYGSTHVTFTTTGPVVTPHGVIPGGKTFSSNGNMFTYLFGPAVGVHASKIYVYGEYLLGGSASNLYGNLSQSIDAGGGTITVVGSQHPFTQALGGGLDVNLNKHFALRLAQMDWVLTRYTNPINDTNNQHSFRYLGGVVFTFGAQ
jgi:hypothetical protein